MRYSIEENSGGHILKGGGGGGCREKSEKREQGRKEEREKRGRDVQGYSHTDETTNKKIKNTYKLIEFHKFLPYKIYERM